MEVIVKLLSFVISFISIKLRVKGDKRKYLAMSQVKMGHEKAFPNGWPGRDENVDNLKYSSSWGTRAGQGGDLSVVMEGCQHVAKLSLIKIGIYWSVGVRIIVSEVAGWKV